MTQDIKQSNTSVLAYVGDAVYEMYIRKYVVGKGGSRPDLLNKEAVRYVRAEAQAVAAKALQNELNEDETGVLRRGKNKKITSMPKHVDPGVYKWATALEALMGYLFLMSETERLEELIARAIEIIEKNDIEIKRWGTEQ